MNVTAYEEHSIMLHCVATGDPKPTIYWDKNQLQENWDPNRFTVSTTITFVCGVGHVIIHGMWF